MTSQFHISKLKMISVVSGESSSMVVCAMVGQNRGMCVGIWMMSIGKCRGYNCSCRGSVCGGNKSCCRSDDNGCLVDGNVSWILGFNSGLVGLDVGPESGGIGDVVDDTDSSVGVAESVRSSDVAMGVTGFLSETAARQVALVVAKVVDAVVL